MHVCMCTCAYFLKYLIQASPFHFDHKTLSVWCYRNTFWDFPRLGRKSLFHSSLHRDWPSNISEDSLLKEVTHSQRRISSPGDTDHTPVCGFYPRTPFQQSCSARGLPGTAVSGTQVVRFAEKGSYEVLSRLIQDEDILVYRLL